MYEERERPTGTAGLKGKTSEINKRARIKDPPQGEQVPLTVLIAKSQLPTFQRCGS